MISHHVNKKGIRLSGVQINAYHYITQIEKKPVEVHENLGRRDQCDQFMI